MTTTLDEEEGGSILIRNKRGVLALLQEPLPTVDYDPDTLAASTLRMKYHRKKRHSRRPDDDDAPLIIYQDYDPSKSAFTLFFVGDSTNLNAIRFRPKLVQFCQQQSDHVQIICVLNGNDDESFCDGTGFMYMTFNHPNRSALLLLLAVPCLPSVVVVENQSGRRITDLGMQAIEMNDTHPEILLTRWKKNQTGLDPLQWTMASCHVS